MPRGPRPDRAETIGFIPETVAEGALCRQPRLRHRFHPDADPAAAVAVCSGCPVLDECRAYVESCWEAGAPIAGPAAGGIASAGLYYSLVDPTRPTLGTLGATKTCTGCKRLLDLDAFGWRKTQHRDRAARRPVRMARCKDCMTAARIRKQEIKRSVRRLGTDDGARTPLAGRAEG